MIPATLSTVWLCARLELRLSVRSRWTQTFAIVFAVLSLAVASSGYILSGGSGMQDFARTSASLVQLVLLLVPLASLMFGVMALTAEPGAAELLFSQPVPRHTILAGKVLGVFLALVGAQAIGFGSAGLVMFVRTGQDDVGSFMAVVAGSVALTGVFLSLAAAIAAGETSTRRARNMAVALVVWFIGVVLFDVAALGVASLLPSGPASRVLMAGAILNPVDAVRTGTLLAVEGTTAFGAASLAFLRFTSGTTGAALWLLGSTVAWILVPLAVGIRRLSKADIG